MTLRLIHGDCVERMAEMAPNSVDAIVCDPPYGLQFMGKEWDNLWRTQMMQCWHETWARQALRVLKPGAHLLAFGGTRTYHQLACAIEDAGFEIRDQIGWLYGTGFPKSGLLKPAWEPIVMARKPCEGTRKANVEKWGTGGLNIDGCRVAAGDGANRDETGRWPANVIHDGSDEVLAAFPDAKGQLGPSSTNPETSKTRVVYGKLGPAAESMAPRGDTGTAARFFYSSKASAKDRAGSKHPTVKPVALMRYLCRLVTPPGGVVLDPFAGSGTTGAAALEEGLDAILIEKELEYMTDLRRRFVLDSLGEAYDRTD